MLKHDTIILEMEWKFNWTTSKKARFLKKYVAVKFRASLVIFQLDVSLKYTILLTHFYHSYIHNFRIKFLPLFICVEKCIHFKI